MGSEPSESPNWHSIIRLANCPNRNSPTDFSDESKCFASDMVARWEKDIVWHHPDSERQPIPLYPRRRGQKDANSGSRIAGIIHARLVAKRSIHRGSKS